MALESGDGGRGILGAPPAMPRRGRKLSREVEVMGAGIIILVGAFVYPYLANLAAPILPGCLFHRITGLPCLLCGMTRSLAATAHGHLVEAFRFHLLGPPLFVLAITVSALLAAEYALSRHILPRPGERSWRHIAWGTLGLLIAAWIARLVFFGVNV
jgi:hypothetical protein